MIIELKIVEIIYKYWLYRKFKSKTVGTLGKRINFSRATVLEDRISIYDNVDVAGSYVGRGTYVCANSKIPMTKIGRFCSIGQNVRTNLGIHPVDGFVSSHPSFYSLKKQSGFTFTKEQLFEEHLYVDKSKRYVCEIGNDVWIGNDVIILDGVKIGDGAVLATRSVVTKDVFPYSVVGGVPAKVIKKRFEEEDINFLLNLKWWDKSFEWLQANAYLMKNINTLKELVNESNKR